MTEQQQRLEALQAAIEDYQANGSDLFDRELEAKKADVKHRAMLLLDHRARSRHELKQRLLALDFAPELVEAALEDLAGVNLIDDEAFAKEWVRQRHERRGKSRRMLDQELKHKGVGEHTRQVALEQIDEDSEHALAASLAEKKARSIKRPPADYAERDKHLRRILGVLARRGFSESMAFGVAKEALEARLEKLNADG